MVTIRTTKLNIQKFCPLPTRYMHAIKILQSFGIFKQRNRNAVKSFARPGRKQARKHVRDVRVFNNIETRAVI